MGIKNITLMLLAGILFIYIAMPTQKDNNSEFDSVKDSQKGYNNKNNMNNNSNKEYNNIDENYSNVYVKEQEEKLKNILENMKNIQSAQVMITLKSSKEQIVLKDNPYVREENETDEAYESEEETVIIEDNEGNALPYVIKELNPEIEGIVVVIKSNNISMEKEVNDVVLALFDIPVHKIKVMDMKY